MSLYPLPSLLLKKQLTKEGLECVALVVIPGLAQTLDKSLKDPQSLYAQLEAYNTLWIGPQTSGRTKSWSLFSLRKASTKISKLPLSHHDLRRLRYELSD